MSRRKRLPTELRVNFKRIAWKSTVKHLGGVSTAGLGVNKFDTPERWHSEHTSNWNSSWVINECQTKLRIFKAIIKSQQTYSLPIWGCVPRFKSIEQICSRISSGGPKIPWLVRNREIVKRLKPPSITGAASQLVSDLQATVVTHTNPSVPSLVRFQRKPNNRQFHPCHLFVQSKTFTVAIPFPN